MILTDQLSLIYWLIPDVIPLNISMKHRGSFPHRMDAPDRHN